MSQPERNSMLERWSPLVGIGPSLTGWVQQNPAYRLLPIQLSAHALGIVLPKGQQYEPLRARINQSLGQWQSSGWLRSRIQSWGLTPPRSPADTSHQFDRLNKMLPVVHSTAGSVQRL